ncbi:hypothetical protein GOODEAATRI_018940 [Goodea atripinnis]|uniref:Ribosome receptor lysine/proline rich domain-containing protein n=1 Tax=Goodea atripinnis TaxID=208336 RepID=A0ABV0MTA4_9TELE
MDIYDSQYLLILAPSLVIALMFLFFWLFMKETSYDEVLARQKRDLKLPPTKPDSQVKLKELLSGLSSLPLSEAEAVSVIALLREKSPSALDAWHKELQLEKQKSGRVEAMMREQRAAMEKELGGMQAKAQGSYQELQTMQIKCMDKPDDLWIRVRSGLGLSFWAPMARRSLDQRVMEMSQCTMPNEAQVQRASQLALDQIQKRIQEKDVKLKSVEESLQAAQVSISTKEKMVEVWAFPF